ncbi:eukaryotic mitochondrial regulator protein-domain-containing protein [Annulohypoxylon maeteangense]|uniref:eukaryotic mitochondrial regulator protein-domain-containing protein n=1 Tax=Annulohypoxylon maeteangense TaxID=1927788 RepID=UPI002008E269|nr:eukaryotic mitochondrial regulator protein-domain-containing protein [Annulohypoxylon maeteangense]KAI0886073.1 eukaryotic mitochondrial regulator protein-domain-containing protein [Annulohypoxylon maeteangense]
MPPRLLIPSASAAAAASAVTRSTLPLNVNQLISLLRSQTKANFSTTSNRTHFSKGRRLFRQWIKGFGATFRKHVPGDTNYLRRNDFDSKSDKPFPINPQFRSEPVLDDHARELIWEKVMRNGEAIKAVSAELGVDIRRVAAIVRLKEVEKDWLAKGQILAKPYAKAILAMLPTHTFKADQRNEPFEPINELHVHPYTMKQIFWPTSESRHFTRADAAKAFHPKMLSADERVPHPELIQMEKEVLEGHSLWDASERFKQAVMESERRAAQKEIEKASIEEKYTTRVHTKRFEYRFKQINSENVGSKGRARNAVGWRYGAPHYDRSKGEIKIPTSVP